MKRIITRERFKRMLFTPREIERIDKSSAERQLEYYTGRFSAKESVVKALGTGFIRGVWWQDVEVLSSPLGNPHVVLHNGAAELLSKLNLSKITVSISHKRDFIVSIVVME